MKALFTVATLLLMICGCVSPEEKEGFWRTGFSVTKIQDDIFKLTFKDESYPSAGKPTEAALSRCAAVTLDNGYQYFVFLDERSIVIRCFNEKPEDVPGRLYDARQIKLPAPPLP
jgi:hypothetical protein